MSDYENFTNVLQQLENVTIDGKTVTIDNIKYSIASESAFTLEKDNIIYRLNKIESEQTSRACLELFNAKNIIDGNLLILPNHVTGIYRCDSKFKVKMIMGPGVRKIYDNGFYHSYVKKVIFPNLKTIGKHAFRTSELQYIPDLSNIEGILTGFDGCSKVVGCQRILPDGNIVYEKDVIRIPKNITKIENCFELYHSHDFNIIFEPDDKGGNLTLNNAFHSMNISSITNWEKYKSITGREAFPDCTINKLIVPKNFDVDLAFYCTTIDEVTDYREKITNSSYQTCKFNDLTKIDLNNAKVIGNSALANTNIESLDNLNLPTSQLEEICENAFSNCSHLKKVNVNVKKLGKGAFSYCGSIEEFNANSDIVLDNKSIPFYLSVPSLNPNINNLCFFKRDFDYLPLLGSNIKKYKNSYYVGTKDNPYMVCVHTDLTSMKDTYPAIYNVKPYDSKKQFTVEEINQLREIDVEYHPDCKYVIELSSIINAFKDSILSKVIEVKDNSQDKLADTAPYQSCYIKTVSTPKVSMSETNLNADMLVFKNDCKEISVDNSLKIISNTFFPEHLENLHFDFKKLSNPVCYAKFNLYLPEKVDNIQISNRMEFKGNYGPRFFITKNTSPIVVQKFAYAFGYDEKSTSLKIEILNSDDCEKNKVINYRDYISKYKKSKDFSSER